MTCRVGLADDQQVVRAGFRLILESEDDLVVVGEAADGRQAVELARSARPDVLLMDIQMPGMDGLAATREIMTAPWSADVRVLILTTFERDEYVFEALRAGAGGFLLKNSSPEDLIQAIRIVAAGESLLAPSVTRRVIAEFARLTVRPRPPGRLDGLTDRETEVLQLVAAGHSNAEIAGRLYVGEATVKTHVSHLLTKLGLRDRVQAVVFAYESGLIRPGV
ncbi:MAG TPA: response regulator transcription factor [Mycobacteriales bacterium]|nr:response regulator transcription factor [Mycobacteriales bacterium]